jgi:hypothetical protein
MYKASDPPKRSQPPPQNAAHAMGILDVWPGRKVLAFDKSEEWWKLDELPLGLTDFLYFPLDALSINRNDTNYTFQSPE